MQANSTTSGVRLDGAWLKRLASLLLLAGAAWLLYREFSKVEARALVAVLARIPVTSVATAAAFTVASYFLLSLFDTLALRHFGLRLRYRLVLLTSFISYAFNFSLGYLVGGVAVRYRLYAKWGLEVGDIVRITVYAVTASAAAYMLVSGAVQTLVALPVPEGFRLPSATFRPLGIALFACGLGYLALCWHRERPLRLGRWHYDVPDLSGAGPQLLVAGAQWCITSIILYSLLPEDAGVPFTTLLAVHLIAALAGALTHVPGGLGVVEATFVGMLGGTLPRETILGTVLAYRAVYQLAPLLLAATLFILVEARTLLSAKKVPG